LRSQRLSAIGAVVENSCLHMTKALKEWQVLPHRRLERLGASIMTVTGDLQMPLTTLQRRMTVVRLKDGRLVVFSAIALDDAQMQVLEDFGEPGFLVVPSHLHRNDAYVWKLRYPGLVVVAPNGARRQVEEVVPVDTSQPDLGSEVRFVEVAGTAGREGALEVREGQHLSLVLNDIVGNLPASAGLVLRALGFAADRPRIPRAIRMALVSDKGALRAQLEAWAARPIERILVSHGSPIDDGASEVLRQLAGSL
jgi:hypothetical protein